MENPNRPWKKAIFSGARHAKAHGHSICTARYRYTEWAPHKKNGKTEFERYDLKYDPREFQNPAHDSAHRAIRHELVEQLNQGWRARGIGHALFTPTIDFIKQSQRIPGVRIVVPDANGSATRPRM